MNTVLQAAHELTPDELAPYLRVHADRQVRPANDFTQEVLDYYLCGERITGVYLPFTELENKFRLRAEETTLLAGINGSGKSLMASQFLLSAMVQKQRCLSISLEMSPKSQLARMWRQASLEPEPTLDFGVDFNQWTKNKLWFFDQQGSIDLTTLLAVIRWSVDHFGINIVLVDSLMTMNIASDNYNAQKDCICALANAARSLQLHIILVCHARKGKFVTDKLDRWSIRGASEIADRADNILILQRTFEKDPLCADAHLNLAKARHFDGAECELDLWLDMESMNYMTHNQTLEPLTEYKNG
jgi:twinkle protein